MSGSAHNSRGRAEEVKALRARLEELKAAEKKRERTEKALRASEARFRGIFDSVKDAIFIERTDGRILDVNAAACALLGYSRRELLSRRVGDIVPPERASRLPLSIQEKTLEKGVYVETEEFRKDGRRIPVEVSCTLVRMEGKERVIAIVRDITERKRIEKKLRAFTAELEKKVTERTAELSELNERLRDDIAERRKIENALRESRAKYEAIVESYDGFIYICSQDFRVEFANERFKKHLGHDPTGKSCYREIYNRKSKCPWCQNHRVLAGETVCEEVRSPRNGRWYEIINTPIMHLDGSVSKVAMIQDINDRKEAVEAIRERAESYRSLFEDSPISLWVEDFTGIKEFIEKLRKRGVRDFDGYFTRHPDAVRRCAAMVKIVDVNRMTLKLFGARSKDDFTRDLGRFFDEESYDVFKEELVALAGNETSWEREAVNKTLSGARIHVNLKWSVAPGDEEAWSKVIVSLVDITERKRAEAKLREEERFLSSVFSSIQDGISVLDNTLTVISVNPTMQKWYSHALPLIGKKCYEAYHERTAPCEICPTRSTIESRKAARELVPKRGPGGEIVGWLDLYSFPLFDTVTGKLRGVIEYVRDITESKRAEEAVRRSEKKYRALMEGASDAILLFDTGGAVLEVNRRAEELLGYPGSRLMEMRLPSLHPPEVRGRVEAVFEKVLREGKGALIDVPALREDLSHVPVDLTASAIEYGGKKVVQAIYRDISERKKIERMKDHLIRDISHNLKTPIAMMEMACEIGRKAIEVRDIARVRDAQRIVGKNLKTLGKDVHNILELFALGRGGIARKRSRVSLRKIISEIVSDLRYLIEDRKLEVEIDITDKADGIVAGKRDIRILFYNLMDNAVKFTRSGGVRIRGVARGGWSRVTVEDTGEGITRRERDMVFDRFYKRDAAIPGTGLGLAICREIVQMYGGSIGVESRGRGRGTTVTVRLPRKR